MSWPSTCLVAAKLTQLRMQASFNDASGGPAFDTPLEYMIHSRSSCASLTTPQHDWTYG